METLAYQKSREALLADTTSGDWCVIAQATKIGNFLTPHDCLVCYYADIELEALRRVSFFIEQAVKKKEEEVVVDSPKIRKVFRCPCNMYLTLTGSKSIFSTMKVVSSYVTC